MKIGKIFTALRFKPVETIQGAVIDFDGEHVTLRLFDGRTALVPLRLLPGPLKANEVVTARVPKDDLVLR
ncbi:MAG: hypothetical protein JST80_10725 [Bdellovibrionales bacterium]|nr:hypothetical protein [Bdellovibrionales bacterium]